MADELLVKPPPYNWYSCDEEELVEVLGREVGFCPGPIFVREFHSNLTDVGVCCYRGQDEEMYTSAAMNPEVAEENDASVYSWWSSGQFLLPFGNYYGIDGLGRVHSS